MKKSSFHVIIGYLGMALLICYSNLEVCQAKTGALAETNPLACALFFAKRIPDPMDKVEQLLQVATRYVEAGQKKRGLEILSLSLRATEKIKPLDSSLPYKKAWVFASIASEYAKLGQKEKTLEILSEALQLVKELDYACDEPISRAWALAEIAGGYAKAGQYRHALRVAETIEETDDKASALTEIAAEYTKVGQKEKALETLSKALQIAKTIQNENRRRLLKKTKELLKDFNLQIPKTIQDENRPYEGSPLAELYAGITYHENRSYEGSALAEVANEYAKLGQKEKALEVLSEALQIAKIIDDGEFLSEARPSILVQVADNYAEIGEKEKALEVLSEALQAVKELEYPLDKPHYRAEALTEIAAEYMKVGQKEKALEILSSAFLLAEGTKDPSGKDWALCEISGGFAKAGQYHRAFQIVKKIEGPFQTVVALLEIADWYGKSGQRVDNRAKKILHEIITEAE